MSKRKNLAGSLPPHHAKKEHHHQVTKVAKNAENHQRQVRAVDNDARYFLD